LDKDEKNILGDINPWELLAVYLFLSANNEKNEKGEKKQ
jgi:hypothetical protein